MSGRPALRPRPLVGQLAPGERSTRQLSCVLPKDHVPVIQNFAGGQVQLVEFSDRAVTVENKSPKRAFYMVNFMSEAALQTVFAAKNLVDNLLNLRKGSKREDDPDNH